VAKVAVTTLAELSMRMRVVVDSMPAVIAHALPRRDPAGRHGRRGRRDGERGEPEAIEAAGLSFILGSRRDQVICYQYKADRARRTLRGIDEQAAQAEQAVAGKTPVKRNRFIQLSGGTRSVNRELATKARALAGIKGYVTNLAACPTARRSPRSL